MDAQTLANIARRRAHSKGYTTEVDLDARYYTSKEFNRVIFGTEFESTHFSFGVHEVDGMTRVFIDPADLDKATRALDALKDAVDK